MDCISQKAGSDVKEPEGIGNEDLTDLDENPYKFKQGRPGCCGRGGSVESINFVTENCWLRLE